MLEKIALLQITIHHLTNRQVVINEPRNMIEMAMLNTLHKKAILWGKAVNLKILARE
jgi:hypothetical protein